MADPTSRMDNRSDSTVSSLSSSWVGLFSSCPRESPKQKFQAFLRSAVGHRPSPIGFRSTVTTEKSQCEKGFQHRVNIDDLSRNSSEPDVANSNCRHPPHLPDINNLNLTSPALPTGEIRQKLRLDFSHINNGRKATLGDLGHRTQIERLRSYGMSSAGKLQINKQTYKFTAEDLKDLGLIGQGNYGTVNKMKHTASETIMAVKRIRSTVDEKDQKQLLMDLDVVMRSNDCPYIVQFYGALFKEGDCWICMEIMDISLDKFYKFIYNILLSMMPEEILGKVAVATLKALNYLKEKLKIIHRDVKPSNILLDRKGNIKLCDFGISGQLVDSIAKSRDAGCRPYMAPERIDPRASSRGYDVRSDVWSLGITLMELSTGRFPYPKWDSVFDQLTQVVQGPPPSLRTYDSKYSDEFKSFLYTCLIKDERRRPKYGKLLNHPFICRYEEEDVDVASYVCNVIDQYYETQALSTGS